MVEYNNIKEFMRFINNAKQELIIRGSSVFDQNNNLLAHYKKINGIKIPTKQ